MALEHASTELGERGIAGWERLELRTTSPTRSPLIRRFTFTYWPHHSDTRVPENLSYVKLWSRLGPTERVKLLTLTGGGRPTTTLVRLLTAVAGSAILVTGPDGTPRLPRTFRVFLRVFVDHKRDDHR